MLTKTASRLAAVAAIPLIIGLFTACSSSSPSADGTKSDTPSASKHTDLADWQLAYAKCMRDEGVDMPDPGPNGELTSTVTADQSTYSAASKTCTGKLGAPPAAPGTHPKTKQEVLDEQLKIAKCFRDNGVDMPDPSEGHISGIPGDAPSNVIKKCTGADIPAGAQIGVSQ